MTTADGVVTATVLFTDMVGSTALRARLGDADADVLFDDHDVLLASCVEAHAGIVVKTLGDGVLATFSSAAQALEAAALVQRRVEQRARRFPLQAFQLRVGVSAGDVSIVGDDIAGTPVVEAHRLCGAAEGGQVLVTDVVRLLSGSRSPGPLLPLGPVLLRGLPDPVQAYRLEWERGEPLVEHGVGLPSLLVRARSLSYVGRAEQLARARVQLDRALNGASGSVLLTGEPGIGKTRTAAEVARTAADAGAIVLYGRCDEDLGAPYQPFVEALEAYVRGAVAPRLGRLGRELGRLLPELPDLVPGTPAPVVSDPRTEEYRLFEAVAAWLAEASQESGLVLVLDDLHWADTPTLSLLLHVLRSTEPSRLLVIGTFRDTDVVEGGRLSQVLADVWRLPGSLRLTLSGLREDEVLQLMTIAAGHGLDREQEELAVRVCQESDGNPFFVSEMLRHLVESHVMEQVDGRWRVTSAVRIDVPASIREVIGRRLQNLSARCATVLASASVIGRDFSLDLLALLTDLTDDDVLDVLDEARRARLVEETGQGRFRFTHVLVRTALYDQMSPTRKARAHALVAASLEQLHPQDLVALAHHALQAQPSGASLLRAVGWAVMAGEQALEARALAEAGERFSAVIGRLDRSDPAHQPLLVRALCGLGEAQRDQGDQGFRTTLAEAGELADLCHDTAGVVRASLADDRGTTLVAAPDAGRLARLERALDLIPAQPSVARARLLARMVGETTFSGDTARRRRLTMEAEAMVRQLDDRTAVAQVMVRTGMAAHMLSDWRTSLARARQCVALAESVGDPALRVTALSWLAASLVVAGDLGQAEDMTAAMAIAADEASPTMNWFARVAQVKFVSLRGEYAAANAENDACLDLALQLQEPDAEGIWGAVAAGIASNAGMSASFADAAGAFADSYPTVPSWRAAHLSFLAEAGRVSEAQTLMQTHLLEPERLMEEPFAYQGPWSLSVAASHLQDGLLGRRVHRVLCAHRGRWSHLYVGILGPVTWALGRCAQATGALDVAVTDLTEALEETQRAGAIGLSGLVAMDLAEVFAQRAGSSDRVAGLAVLEQFVGPISHLDERLEVLREALAS